ncbi:MAG TPA: hypothetical protein VHA35_25215 [Dongiaceae bacterium]|jgi:hypothetical protein|nr:hypothetical protein [Dongiaceae bacterium]
MAEIAQIYLLPPPVRPSTADRALAAPSQGPEDGSVQAAASEQGRARRFRFRVYEGGEASATGTELDTRRTGGKAAVTASGIDLGNPDSLESRRGQSGGGATFYQPNAGASSAFLAQSIAQEQLGEGLHNPPYAAAATAYTRTGAALTQRASAGVDVTA